MNKDCMTWNMLTDELAAMMKERDALKAKLERYEAEEAERIKREAECELCRFMPDRKSRYCPGCGKRMMGE